MGCGRKSLMSIRSNKNQLDSFFSFLLLNVYALKTSELFSLSLVTHSLFNKKKRLSDFLRSSVHSQVF